MDAPGPLLPAEAATNRSSKKAPATAAALLKPGEMPAYFDSLDPETKDMMRAAQADQDDTPGETFKAFLMRSPFKLGFLATIGGLAAILLGQALGQLSAILIYIVAALFIASGVIVSNARPRRSVTRTVASTCSHLSTKSQE